MPSWSLNELITKLHKQKQAEARRASADAELEQDTGDASYGADEIPPYARGEYTVRFTSVRSRLLDHDDCAAKYLLDAIARAKIPGKEEFFIIPGDGPHQVTTEIRQRKCRKGEPDHVIIDVYLTAEGPSPEQP